MKLEINQLRLILEQFNLSNPTQATVSPGNLRFIKTTLDILVRLLPLLEDYEAGAIAELEKKVFDLELEVDELNQKLGEKPKNRKKNSTEPEVKEDQTVQSTEDVQKLLLESVQE